jgi:hypothetical protein
MGRFDMLTQLEKKEAPAKQPATLPVAPVKKSSPPPLSQKSKRREAQRSQIKPDGSSAPVPEPVPVGEGVRVGVPPPVPLVPKVKRVIKQRQPFDIYEDQYERLKQIKEAEEGFVNGRGMSQMVREAIDNYLRDHGTPRE